MAEQNPTYLAIYQRAQNVANLLAEQNGWKTTPDAFCTTSDNPRILTLFSNACEILQELEGHEMQDIIDEVEAVKPSNTFADMVAKSKESAAGRSTASRWASRTRCRSCRRRGPSCARS